MPTELEELKDTLDSYHIPVSMEWLESCAEWCKNDLNPNYTIKELYRSVYQQWLFLGKLNLRLWSRDLNCVCLCLKFTDALKIFYKKY